MPLLKVTQPRKQSVAWVGAGIAAVSAVSSYSAAGNAADAQEAATSSANGLQKYQFDETNRLAAPTINAGNSARDRLTYLLGLSPTGFSGTTTAGGASSGATAAAPQTADQIRNSLLAQFTTPGSGGGYVERPYGDALVSEWVPNEAGAVDEAGLQAAVDAQLAQQNAATQATTSAAASDPAYGSLAQGYTPETFSYTGEDLYSDPSYQFRLDQGQKALDRSGAAAGRFLSGAQLQGTSDYNQAAASQEYGNAYNRALSTFGTNESNRANAYQNNFQNTVNPLLSLAGSSTLAAGNLGQAGAAYAGAVGNNLTNQANATGAAGIAGSNAATAGLTGAVNNYQQNQLLQQYLNNKTGVNNNPTSSFIDGLLASNNAYGTSP